MEPLIWSLGIAITIYFSWNISLGISNKVIGSGITMFWIFWVLGGSAWFGFSALSGSLVFVQIALIVFIFYVSFKMWRKEKIVYNYKKNIKKITNQNVNLNISNISGSEIRLIENGKDHRKLLLKTLDQADKTIVIFSGWLSDYSVNEEFKKKIKICLERGVNIFIAWGYKNYNDDTKNIPHIKAGRRNLAELKEWSILNKTKGTLQTLYFANHTKILICDTNYIVLGSFNWLGSGGGHNFEERSYIISNKTFINKELLNVLSNLNNSDKTISRKKTLEEYLQKIQRSN